MTITMRVVPKLFPYSASKSEMMKHILARIPEHEIYVEPFAGSGAVFFNKAPAKCEILNDRNDFIVTVYRVVQDYGKFRRFMRMMYYMTHSDSEFRRAAEILKNREKYDDVTVAYAVCVRIMLNYTKELNTGDMNCNIYLHNRKPVWTTPDFLRGLLPYLHRRLQNAQILCRDGIEVMGALDRENAFMFIDAPYFQTDTTLCDIKNPGETASYDFHKRLLDTAKASKAKIMMTSFLNDLYEYELRDWNKAYIHRKARMRFLTDTKRGHSELVEVIYMNYEPPRAPDKMPCLWEDGTVFAK